MSLFLRNMEVEDSQYRPDGENAQLKLMSADGTEFKVNTVILTMGSRFFREMLEIPRDPAEAGKPVELAENGDIIAALLDIVHADERPMPDLSDFDFVWRLLKAADKYDMPRVLPLVRSHVMFKPGSDVIEQYALASAHDWAEERRWAAVQALGLDLHSILNSSGIKKLSTDGIVKLLKHRTERRRLLEDGIISIFSHECGDPEDPDTGWRYRDPSPPWKLAMAYILSELDKCPRGDNIGTWLIWHDYNPGLWDETCGECGTPIIKPEALWADLQERIVELDAKDLKDTSL
ncbi:hypothetical protein BD410DRAFT_575472 [Rickenella mellea]|uniref:BTB domain-containing protein n=1 Tax=Rickenella mellea TaxID=50990 RepID=A0A4Y7QGA6_9AGAM|nr:hypothetical protein BD410DRAFT_575472 [Rickenella mellea]